MKKDWFEKLRGNLSMIEKTVQSDVENVQSKEYTMRLISDSIAVIKEIEESYNFYEHDYETQPRDPYD